jgi:hypothetical protein
MNRLVQEIIKNFLPEEEKKQTTALYAGGFKPPTAGHFAVVQEALKQNPEIEEFIIFVGSKERDGVSQDESLLIWEIYNKYLPFKVKIEPSSLAPIRAVYDFAKNHPTREILWILGAREDNEQDFTDIGSRTKSITNYPNIEARTIITKGGVSGTAARNASKISLEKFEPFLPSVLTPEEKQEVYQIVSGKIQENIQSLKYTEPNFNVEWEEAVRYPEFEEMGKERWILKAKRGLPLKYSQIKNVLGNVDLNFDGLEEPKKQRFASAFQSGTIEMPIAVKFSDDDYDLVAGNTRLAGLISNGVDPQIWVVDLSNQQLNENASYSQHIDVKQKIKELTQHMLDKGMNIVPLPKVVFKHGDAENAKQFLGKTAYYNPETVEIVLYTEGRHPKDIVRSFSHEMIHHIQNLEGRLGNVATTNTLEDDHLDKIEQEANLNGTMTFRNWTDSLNEAIVGNKVVCDGCGWSWNIEDGGNNPFTCHKCGHDNTPLQEKKSKDPFGLNAYAMELARLREKETEYTIYCDMDSVLVDFDLGYQELTGMTTQQADANGVEAFWEPLTKAGAKFWITLQWMPDGKQLWDYIKKYNPILLSAPSREESSKLGKRVWVKRELPGVKLILKYASQKQEYASSTSILIDDRQKNIDQWEAAGGIGILHTSTPNTIKQLQQLGL